MVFYCNFSLIPIRENSITSSMIVPQSYSYD